MSTYSMLDVEKSQNAFEREVSAFVSNCKIDELETYINRFNSEIKFFNSVISEKKVGLQHQSINSYIIGFNKNAAMVLKNYVDAPKFYNVTKWEDEDKKKQNDVDNFKYYLRTNIKPRLDAIKSLLVNDNAVANSSIIKSIQDAYDKAMEAQSLLAKNDSYKNIEYLKKTVGRTKKTLNELKRQVDGVSNRWKNLKIDDLII